MSKLPDQENTGLREAASERDKPRRCQRAS